MPHAPDPAEEDLEFEEEATAAEDELVMEGDEDADDWFADGDDLGAGDDGADDDVDGDDFSDDDEDDLFGTDEDSDAEPALPAPTEATTALLERGLTLLLSPEQAPRERMALASAYCSSGA